MANYIHDLRQLVGHRHVILTFAGGILVNAAYTAAKQQYGSQFTTYLNANNLTPQTFKQTLRLNALSAAALHAQVKPTTAQLQNLYQSTSPRSRWHTF